MAAPSIAKLIARGTKRLAAAGVDSPDFDASSLLASVLEVELRCIPVMRNEVVSAEAERLFIAYVARRAEREPLQYISGDTEFYGLAFKCNAQAMVPRPETETLVAAAIDRIGALKDDAVIADIGTGTGIIAISLARALPGVKLYATDISPGALALAEENVRMHRLAERITLLPPGPFLAPLYEDGVADQIEVIVANPPYVRTAEVDQLQPEICRFEPRPALDGGPDGLDCYRELLMACSGLPRLRLLIVEIGVGQAEAVSALVAQHFGAAQIEIMPDLIGIKRVVVVQI